ncbi:FAD binding domain-containing protein [Halobacteria archaeon AArc-dxtr1]|nr:FAD binding domain-containing protein [Halobacteria archaeon AArc-dxtr1]
MPVNAYHRPTSLDDALELTADRPADIEIISGGTITMPAVNEGHDIPEQVLDIRELDLDYVDNTDEGITLGPTLTLTDVIEDVDVPLLQEGARHSGGWAVRNSATIGGNLFAPAPLGDAAVALLALDATVEVQRSDGSREIPLVEFYEGSGETALEPSELVTAIRVPESGAETAYQKFTRNQEPAPPVVTVAIAIERDAETVTNARIAANGAGPHPVRLTDAETAIEGTALDEAAIEQAADAAAEAADPPTDAIATSWYRERMLRKHCASALAEIGGVDGDDVNGAVETDAEGER